MSILISDLKILGRLISEQNIEWRIGDQLLEVENINSHNSSRFKIAISGDGIAGDDATDCIFSFDKSTKCPAGFQTSCFNYIKNNDGSIRWFFPSNHQKPVFLKLFNASSKKALVMKWLVSVLFRLGLGKLVKHGKLTIFHKDDLLVNRIASEANAEQFAVFMGTVGPNRKAVLAAETAEGKTSFIKVPLNQKSVSLVKNELSHLNNFNNCCTTVLEIPEVEKMSMANAISLANIKPTVCHLSNQLVPEHFQALKELASLTSGFAQVSSTSWYYRIGQQIEGIEVNSRLKESLQQLHSNIEAEWLIPTSMAHGDFTPWNMYISDHKLSLYDWELAIEDAPMLFDLFHFIFQTEVLVHQSDFPTIQSRIKRALSNPDIQTCISRHKIDVELHYRLYLLINISYYAELYSLQSELHPQAFWLMNIWEQALSEVNKQPALVHNPRKQLIADVFQFLNARPYVWLKSRNQHPLWLAEDSDIDILLPRQHADSFNQWLDKHPLVAQIKIDRLSDQQNFSIFLINGAFLSIDIISNFRRKELELLSVQEVMAERYQNTHHVFVPSLKHEFEYVWQFYWLNGSEVPQKYMESFHKLNGERKSCVLGYIKHKYGIEVNSLQELKAATPQRLKIMKTQLSQGLLRNTNNYLSYLTDTAKKVIAQKGFMLSVSGVDGAGKSTLIQDLKHKIHKKYRREVVVLRHRPSLLPILSAWKHGKKKAEEISVSKLPRTGNNQSTLGSLFRFGYYFADYLFGQLYIFFKHVMMGKIVIYDRYYFDFINDAKRSNIMVNSKLAKFLYRFIHKPALNFFLYAQPEVILERKQELEASTIESLTDKYLGLFNELECNSKKAKYISIENIDKQNTLDIMLNEFLALAS